MAGFPPIDTPRANDLRSLQRLADSVRERFSNVEKSVSSSAVGGSTVSTTSLGQLQAQVTQLAQVVSNLVISVQQLQSNAGIPVTQQQLVMLYMDGEPGEDGASIVGPPGPPGPEPQTIYIQGEPGEDGESWTLTP